MNTNRASGAAAYAARHEFLDRELARQVEIDGQRGGRLQHGLGTTGQERSLRERVGVDSSQFLIRLRTAPGAPDR